jgi:hypothetical protein
VTAGPWLRRRGVGVGLVGVERGVGRVKERGAFEVSIGVVVPGLEPSDRL